ncbi:MAG: proline--tRNA ligase [Alphaproteobacteria bacterium]
MGKAPKTAITPTRAENYPEWYQQVIKGADMATNSPVRGCMIIKPWGWGIWERIQGALDGRIKETGHDNAYFPLFIPLRFIQKEAAHVEGFAKEMAVVTHHRLKNEDGELVVDGELEEPLVVRPTSETIIGEAMAEWVQSWRDLPLKLNQWANVVRWEMRPRLFLRTAEFLWQEGHTAHATADEAVEETMTMLEAYRWLAEDIMAVPVICGEKSESERFPGADQTFTIEAMMQDGKALQAGTSHFLGQNFAKAADIKFQDDKGEMRHVWTTSWGVSTRLIGALIMTHADDNGLRLPPAIAPKQIVVVPVLRNDEEENERVLAHANRIVDELKSQSWNGEPVRAHLDDRAWKAPDKRWDWVKKGAPLIVEVGPRDVEKDGLALMRRVRVDEKKTFPTREEFTGKAVELLQEAHDLLFADAVAYRTEMSHDHITDWDSFAKHFKGNDNSGFVRAGWCGTRESEEKLKELAVTIRCIPLDQPEDAGACVITGAPATCEAIFAKAY